MRRFLLLVALGLLSACAPAPAGQPQARPTALINCLSAPHRCGFPDATNTGVPAGTVLTASSGITATVTGTVVDALDVSGEITISANNVVVKRTRVRSSGSWPIRVVDGVTGVLIQDVEVDGLNSTAAAGVGWTGFTCRRCNIHGTVDGIRIGAGPGGTADVEDSYIHDLSANPASGGHQQAISTFGASRGTVHHNTLVWPDQATAVVMMKSDQGPISNMSIDGNLLNGGGYTIYCLDGGAGHGHPTGTRVTNNRFGRRYVYGLFDFDTTVTEFGNVWDDTGSSVKA